MRMIREIGNRVIAKVSSKPESHAENPMEVGHRTADVGCGGSGGGGTVACSLSSSFASSCDALSVDRWRGLLILSSAPHAATPYAH